MDLAISTASFFSKVYTEDCFAEIKKLGLNTCEVFLTTFSEYGSEFCRLLQSRKGGINVYSVHALTNQFEPELFNISPRTRADAETFFDKVTGAAEILGAKYYTFHGPTRLKKKEYKFDYEKLGQRFLELNNKAQAHNVKLAYENVHWTFFSEPSFFNNLKQYCPGLNTVLDIKQAMQNGIDCAGFLEVMGESLVNVHICDYTEDKKLCLPGKGIFDFKALFNRLKGQGYKGPVTIELYASDYKDFSEIGDCIKYLRDII